MVSNKYFLPSSLLNSEQRHEIKKLVDSDYSLRPVWFFTGTYWDTYGARNNLEQAREYWKVALDCLARKTSQHIHSVCAWGKTRSGDYHMHGVILGERGKLKRITQKKVKWVWRGGISDMRLYEPTRGGIPYTLTHSHIDLQTASHCNLGGCSRCQRFSRDYIVQVLRDGTRSADENPVLGSLILADGLGAL